MGRWVLGALVAAVYIGEAAAAQTMRDAGSPGVTFQRAAPPPQPASPPPATAPSRPGLAGPREDGGTVDLFRAGPRTYAPRYDRRSRGFPYYGFPVGPSYYYPYFPYVPAAESETGAHTLPAEETPGFLRLEVQPDTAQVFIDGYFVGGAEDFGTARYPLEPGPHRVELRASGFRTVAFDVRIRPYDTATFTQTLERADSPQPEAATVTAVARAAMPKTLYVIPRCYAGDKRPAPSDLPPGCNVRMMRTIPPARR